jgi:hypothetical protein
MYKIIGADQKTYGPVPAETIRQWIAARRANASTMLQAEGSSDFKPLSEFPEFADALAGNVAPPPLRPPAMPAPAAAAAPPSKTSGFAIASFVCGLLGCLGITAIAGLILGIVALIKINTSQGRLKGNAFAIMGLCFSAFMLVAALPAFSKARQRAQSVNCVNNLKDLAMAARVYASNSGGRLPNETNWCDVLRPHVSSPRVFHCRAGESQLCTYGFNSALSGRNLDGVHPMTVMFFEIPGGWNVSGGPEQMIQRSRHIRSYCVVFADGSARQLQEPQLSTLRWRP